MSIPINEETAEFFGALTGDGCISKYWSSSENCWRYEVVFTGALDDFDYYKEVIHPCCKRNFSLEGRLFTRGDNSTRFHIKSKRLALELNGVGFPIGKKPTSLSIPLVFLGRKKLASSFLRGLFNTDGTIYRLYNKKYANQKRVYSDYLVIQLKMRAKPVVYQTKKILKGFGIHTGKILRESPEKHVLRICSRRGCRGF